MIFALMTFAILMPNDLLQTNFNHLVLNLLLWKSIVSPTLLISLPETLEVTFLVLTELKKVDQDSEPKYRVVLFKGRL